MHYIYSLEGVLPSQLEGFCVGWGHPLDGEQLLRVLRGSYRVILAVEGEQVVGFINAISDGVLSAFLPLLEVRPEFQRRGIGTEMARRMIEELAGLYMVDLCCDESVVPFYERLGLIRVEGMVKRNYASLKTMAGNVKP